MEESLNLLGQIDETFDLKNQNIREYSPIALAFMGDCVFEMIVRTIVVKSANRRPNDMHKIKSSIVKAGTQAKMIELLMDELSEEEQGVYRRGRNAKTSSVAKNASVSDYRMATGFEALMGYLYLNGQTDRAIKLTKQGLDLLGIEV